MIDFDKEFSMFVGGSGDSSVVNAIYNVIPTLSLTQQQIVLALMYYAEKYDVEELRIFVKNYLKLVSDNKNLNFLRSMNFKALLKAWSLEEQVKGIRVTSSQVQDVNR